MQGKYHECVEKCQDFFHSFLVYTGAPGSLAKERALPLGRFRGAFVSSTRTAGSKTLVNVDSQKYYRCFYLRGGLATAREFLAGTAALPAFGAGGTQVPQESQTLHPASSSEWFSGSPLAVSFLVTPCFCLNIQFVSSIENAAERRRRYEERDIGGAADPIAECYYVLKL